jgi:branched-subunit amino acid aminotransferase/4-amino-4-deoxychorismate lyase
MSVTSIFEWRGRRLIAVDHCTTTESSIEAADSWLVSDGRTLGLELHRARFLGTITERHLELDPHAFWDAAVAAIPREGDWFPRVELQQRPSGPQLVFRLRSAPERSRSARLATWNGRDPRSTPTVKGPDLAAMLRVRTSVQQHSGADEAVILTDDGYVVEGAYSGLLWWRGEILCGPPVEFARIDSVTARSGLTLATALGLDTLEEAVTPAELDGTELWVLSALHGIRIATDWVDGPSLAERPGRLATWRARLDALRRPLPSAEA